MKKLKFRKVKPRFKPYVLDKVILDVLTAAIRVFADFQKGRVNISALISDEAKEAAYEAGFPGFMVRIPYPQPQFKVSIPEEGREYVSIMQGRQMGRRALIDQIYGPNGSPESQASYQKRVQFFDLYSKTKPILDTYKDFLPEGIPLLTYETPLEKRILEIRAKQAAQEDSPTTDKTGEILNIVQGATEAPAPSSLDGVKFGSDSRPDQD